MSEHHKKPQTEAVVAVAEHTNQFAALSDEAEEVETDDDISLDSAYKTFVTTGFTHDSSDEVSVATRELEETIQEDLDVHSETREVVTMLTEVHQYMNEVVPVSQWHYWPVSYWIDGELFVASSTAPSATVYRASAIPRPADPLTLELETFQRTKKIQPKQKRQPQASMPALTDPDDDFGLWLEVPKKRERRHKLALKGRHGRD